MAQNRLPSTVRLRAGVRRENTAMMRTHVGLAAFVVWWLWFVPLVQNAKRPQSGRPDVAP